MHEAGQRAHLASAGIRELEITGGHVVSDGVAEHVRQGVGLGHVLGVLADHHRHLALVVEHPLGVRVDWDILVRAGQGVGRLGEHHRVGWNFELRTL